MRCVYNDEKICVGFDCRPHPCVSFLRMDQETYDKLKEYTIHVGVYHKKEYDDTLHEMEGIRVGDQVKATRSFYYTNQNGGISSEDPIEGEVAKIVSDYESGKKYHIIPNTPPEDMKGEVVYISEFYTSKVRIEDPKKQDEQLTVLSYGAGQDSTAILYKLVYDEEFRKEYAPGRLLVLMSDTGNEHPETYKHIEYTKKFCEEKGIEFVFITNEMGYHIPSWPGLKEFYRSKNTIGSKCYPKTCTGNLKIVPIYKYLEEWVGKEYGYESGKKKALKAFAEEHGKITVLIGIAKGEEKRVAKAEAGAVWMQKAINRRYPLIDIGFARAECQQYIASVGHPVPVPSNCMICPFLSEEELVWLHRNYPEEYGEWVELEANKVKANMHAGDKNFGVWGKKYLPEVLEGALAKFGDWSNERLNDYKMSHGHCLTTQY